MLHAALVYARQGLAVFACHWPIPQRVAGWVGWGCSCHQPDCARAAKHPLTVHGFKDATTDADIVQGWWQRWPQANIGIPTGVGFDALDLDGHTGVHNARAFVEEHRIDWSTAPLVRTGSGGWHLLIAPTGAGNRVGLLEGVDYRGAGGYVIAPPSRHVTGGTYRWVRDLNLARLSQVPAPLRSLLDPVQAQRAAGHEDPRPQPRARTPARENSPVTRETGAPVAGRSYGLAALTAETDKVRHAEVGQRNTTLNRAAFRCYQLAATGLLDPDDITAQLTAAARTAGLRNAEITRTLASARHAGLANPRHAPTRTRSPTTGSARRAVSSATDPTVKECAAMPADNFTVLVGNLTDDPTLRYTDNGTAVVNFRLAVTSRVKDENGGWRNGETTFVPVTVWRDMADNVADSLHKGDRAVVTGRLRTRTWTTEAGEQRSITELTAEEVAPSLRFCTVKGLHKPNRDRTPRRDTPARDAPAVGDDVPF